MSLPDWAVVSPARRGHIQRVVALLATWADALDVEAAERARWLRAGWLHDALRDAPGLDPLEHGPAAAVRAAAEGETDAAVLDAVRYHSVGDAGWDRVGRMLYLADYLEPGRRHRRAARAALVSRVAMECDTVLRAVTRARLDHALRRGWALHPKTVEFWNSLAVDRVAGSP